MTRWITALCTLAIVLVGGATKAQAEISQTERLALDRLETKERAGTRYHREGDYERAFDTEVAGVKL